MSQSLSHSEPDSTAPGIGQRLQEARKAAGLSARAATERLPPNLKVSHTALLKFEREELAPRLDLILGLAAIYERPVEWFLTRAPTLTGVHYRNVSSRTTAGEKAAFESRAAYWLAGYRRIELRLGIDRPAHRLDDLGAACGADAASTAEGIRTHVLRLEIDQPLVSAVEFLETQVGARVIEIETESRIDGLAGKFGDEHAVVLNDSLSNDRLRTSALHEAAHIIRGDCDSDAAETKEQETWAFDFASHLLLPSPMLRKAFEGKSMLRLLQFKERFGISLASMVYRAEREALLTKSEARWLWMEFAKRGWKRVEPGRVWADRATRLDTLLEIALRDRKMTLGDVARVTKMTEHEVRRRLERRFSSASIGTDSHGNEKESHEPARLRLVR